MKITYLGQCGFLLEIGGARIVTDPYLTDYVDKSSSGGAWKRLYPAPATLAELNPDLILISHSHGDHLDPWTLGPYFEGGGAAAICAPAPECGALEKLGAHNIIRGVADEGFSVGGALVTPIPCAHTQLHTDDSGRFRELSYIIRANGQSIFFAGDMSFFFGLIERLEDEKCDVLLLPANGRDDARTDMGIIGNIDHIEAAHLAAHLGAKTYIPMHHDLYEINGCPVDAIEAAAVEAGANLRVLAPGEQWDDPDSPRPKDSALL